MPRFAIGKAGALAISVLVADGGDAPTSPLDVVLATFDDEGRPTQRHRVRVERPAAGRPWQFSTELPLARGRHQLRVAAVTADGSKSGLVLTLVEIIEPGRDLRMAPPLLLEVAVGQVGPTASRRFAVGVPLGLQAETTPDVNVSPLRHSVVARGPVSRHPAPATLVIRSDEEWAGFWSHLPTRQAAPPIDFSRATLFAIVAPTGAGHGAPEVTMISDAGTHTIVHWRTAARSSGADMEGANPFVVVALPRAVGPVRFEPVP